MHERAVKWVDMRAVRALGDDLRIGAGAIRSETLRFARLHHPHVLRWEQCWPHNPAHYADARAFPALARVDLEEGLFDGRCVGDGAVRELEHVCIEMELVRGGSVASRVLALSAQWAREEAADVAAGGRGNPHRVRSHVHAMLVRKWVAQTASALAEYHRLFLRHASVRPDNLLLTEGGNNIKLAPVLGVAERQLPLLTRLREREREERAGIEQQRLHASIVAAQRDAAAAAARHAEHTMDVVRELHVVHELEGSGGKENKKKKQPAAPGLAPGLAPSHALTPLEKAKLAQREAERTAAEAAAMEEEAAAAAQAVALSLSRTAPRAAPHPHRLALPGAERRRGCPPPPERRGGPRTRDLAYLSPEALSGVGTVDSADDMWALGCVLTEMMTGRLVQEQGTTGLLAHPAERATGSRGSGEAGQGQGSLPRELAKEVGRSDKTLGLLAKELLRTERERRPTAEEVLTRLARDGAADDRRALADLYAATGGEAWTKSYNWCDDEREIGMWYGVTAVDGRVVKIDLGGNGLRGVLPPSLGMCAQLRCLLLWGNALRGALPDSLVNCGNLEELNVAHNALTGRLPRWLGELSILEGLWADNNRLEGPLPPSLGRLRSLGILQLKHNRLDGRIPPELGGCHALRVLSLASNKLSGGVPASLGTGLTRLQKLALGDNRLVGGIPASLGGLASLKSLSLRLNQLTGPIPLALCGATALSKLQLDGNMLSGPALPPALCESLVQLRELHLQQNSALGGEVPHGIGHLEQLQELKIYSTCLQGALPEELCRCTALKELKLRDNRLSGHLPPNLGALKQLNILSLGGNYIEGKIPASLAQCAQLEGISLSHNKLGGQVNEYREQWHGKLGKLSVVELAFNENMHGSGNEFTQEQFEERFPGVKVVL